MLNLPNAKWGSIIGSSDINIDKSTALPSYPYNFTAVLTQKDSWPPLSKTTQNVLAEKRLKGRKRKFVEDKFVT